MSSSRARAPVRRSRNKTSTAEPFWIRKQLSQMTRAEWESLCDGCGRCCLNKLEDADTGMVYYTNVACRLLDLKRCRCSDYAHRFTKVPDCLQLVPDDPGCFDWLPLTCAYRRLAEGRALEWWHPLGSGDPATVHTAGISVRGKALGEEDVHPDDLEDHIIDWLS